MTCPVCRANHVYSSHRHSILERGPLTWLGVLPFRCGQCQTRFYKIALRDPRRHRKGGDVASPVDVPRAARWTTEMTAEVTVHAPGQPTTVLKGLAENASLEGVRLRLPTGLPDGSLVSVSLQGGPSRLGNVRWNLPHNESGFLHGIRFQAALEPHGPDARPLRRLRLRRFLRRGLIVLIGSALIGLSAYGVDRLIETLRVYAPNYYEPKDLERQIHESQRLMERQRQEQQR